MKKKKRITIKADIKITGVMIDKEASAPLLIIEKL